MTKRTRAIDLTSDEEERYAKRVEYTSHPNDPGRYHNGEGRKLFDLLLRGHNDPKSPIRPISTYTLAMAATACGIYPARQLASKTPWFPLGEMHDFIRNRVIGTLHPNDRAAQDALFKRLYAHVKAIQDEQTEQHDEEEARKAREMALADAMWKRRLPFIHDLAIVGKRLNVMWKDEDAGKRVVQSILQRTSEQIIMGSKAGGLIILDERTDKWHRGFGHRASGFYMVNKFNCIIPNCVDFGDRYQAYYDEKGMAHLDEYITIYHNFQYAAMRTGAPLIKSFNVLVLAYAKESAICMFKYPLGYANNYDSGKKKVHVFRSNFNDGNKYEI